MSFRKIEPLGVRKIKSGGLFKFRGRHLAKYNLNYVVTMRFEAPTLYTFMHTQNMTADFSNQESYKNQYI